MVYMQRRVPARLTDRKSITAAEEFGVLGYVGDTLEAIINKSQKTVHIVLALSDHEHHNITLGDNQRWDINIETETFIKTRFMPYIHTNETIEVDVLWKFSGSDSLEHYGTVVSDAATM